MMTELRTNREHLVQMTITGRIHAATMRRAYAVDHSGVARVLPSVGGIVLNYAVGANCMLLAGDHVEPGVSLKNSDAGENEALMHLACIGNEAIVCDGEAKDARGFVTGKHGGIEHVICYFAPADLLKMKPGDTILIRAEGLGLSLLDWPEVALQSLSPALLDKLQLKHTPAGLEVPCVAEVPAYLMGSGIGSASGYTGDYDIMTGDAAALRDFGLDKLRFGDLVLLRNCDNSYGRQYYAGAGTLGVVVHSNCVLAGHGPGVTTLISSRELPLLPRFESSANLANYFIG